MACNNPLKGFIIGKTDTGRKDLKIAPFDTECVYQPFPGAPWEKHARVLDSTIFPGKIVTDFVQIPCGQCIGCRLEHSRQWAVRCMLEAEEYEYNWFLTLTYDDYNVPYSEYVDGDGVIDDCMTLCKKDLQDFLKRLRSHVDYHYSDFFQDFNDDGEKKTFRYFACGEYGSSSGRPHYHMILFNLPLNDLVFYKSTDFGNLYVSPFLSEKWGKGHVIVGSVSFESSSYVSRYIMKKQKGSASVIYDLFNIVPEYIVMSRNPGIGKKYFFDHSSDIYLRDSIVLDGGVLVKPPRYFDYLMDKIDEDFMAEIKEKRSDIAEHINNIKMRNTTATQKNQFKINENNLKSRTSRLIRPL